MDSRLIILLDWILLDGKDVRTCIESEVVVQSELAKILSSDFQNLNRTCRGSIQCLCSTYLEQTPRKL